MEFMFQLVLVSFMVVALAASNLGSSYRYACNLNTGEYKCTYKFCTNTLDGTQNCTTSDFIPKNIAGQRRASSYRYSCAWNTGVYKCTHIRCTQYFGGHKNCTTSVTTTK
uniref:Seminal fluid protein n=1 Tax=Drosophila melanogaster TaxID=7227 RepID=M9MRU4_DROME|nr:uncharacterized protein Dmel_CG42681 [Drosophila melanogaster]ADV37062.1 uncharacterized protein Dmel_CG42681 [Drosophila melanogaster]|eukprot:NP_001188812.1 uncharacterized protein Dmel_CG42681 [Drosophila melanogaster]